MIKIHLIGTRHTDIYGCRRLKAALESEKPTILTFEGSADYSMEELLNQQTQKFIEVLSRKNVSKKLIKEYLRAVQGWMAFEERGCLKYASERQIPLYFVDEPSWRQQHLKKMELEFSAVLTNILDLETRKIERIIKRQIESISIQDKRDDIYRAAKPIFNPESGNNINKQIILEQICGSLKDMGLYGRRDEIMAKKIRELARNNTDAKIVHIGGLGHLLDDEEGKTLYSRLKEEFNPTRATLLDYD